MKQKIFLILIVLLLVLVSGCHKNNLDTATLKVINCKRLATTTSNAEASLKYKIYYAGKYLKILHATEKITSTDKTTLDTYEKAYKNIYKNYSGLKYYDNTVVRSTDSVTSDTVINYGKIDTKKLLAIEGSDGNVIKNGKVLLADWLKFAKKYGATCDD